MSRPRRRRLLLAAILCLPLHAIGLRELWFGDALDGWELRSGYFEERDGVPGLFVGGEVLHPIHPPIALQDDGSLELPRGLTVVARVDPGAVYDIRSLESGGLPYVVMGGLAGTDYVPYRRAQVERLAATRVLDVSGGEVVWRDWDPVRPLREEEAWLARLTRACGARGEISIEGGPQPVARLGSCEIELADAGVGASSPFLAVHSGTDRVRLARRPAPWTLHRGARTRWLIPILLGVTALLPAWLIGFGSTLSLSLSASLVPAAVFSPIGAIGVFAILSGAAVVAAMGRLLWRLPWRGRAVVALATSVAIAVFASGDREEPVPVACLLTGYSTAEGAGLRSGGIGTFELLDGCTRCTGSTLRIASSGANMRRIANHVCGMPPVEPGGAIVMLGGTNDDYFWWAEGRGLDAMRAALRVTAVNQWRVRRAEEIPPDQIWLSVERSESQLPAQLAEVRRALACADDLGVEFVLLQDFIVSDLVAGRDEPRRHMVDARRAEVEAAGGTFVDLLEALGDEAGISWFADFIHLTEIGHRRVAALACEQLDGRPDTTGSP